MTQVSRIPLNKKSKDEIIAKLAECLANLKNERKISEFLDDFLTTTEKLMLAKRLGVALLIEAGLDYREISNQLKVSTATILQVKRSLEKSINYREVAKNLVSNKYSEVSWLENVLRAKTNVKSRAKLIR